jgi:hypothetical protein
MSAPQADWWREGYVVVRNLYTPERVTWLRATCERILHQWRTASSRAPLSNYFSYQPWFLTPDYLAGLEAQERGLFEAFVAAYAKDWK